MTGAHIGRLVTASLHQAIGEELPQRLEFYENWLHSDGIRDGSIGAAPMMAVLGFLRTEGESYDRVMTRAGTLAAEWSLMSLSPFRTRFVRALPKSLRVRGALRVAGNIASSAGGHSRLIRRVQRDSAQIEVVASVFCAVRGKHAAPLCGFYRAVVEAALSHFGVVATVGIEQCRAMGADSCVIGVQLEVPRPAEEPAAAA